MKKKHKTRHIQEHSSNLNAQKNNLKNFFFFNFDAQTVPQSKI